MQLYEYSTLIIELCWYSAYMTLKMLLLLTKSFYSLDWSRYTRRCFYLMNVCFTLSLLFDLLQALCPALCSTSHFLLALQLDANNHSPINSNGSGTLVWSLLLRVIHISVIHITFHSPIDLQLKRLVAPPEVIVNPHFSGNL